MAVSEKKKPSKTKKSPRTQTRRGKYKKKRTGSGLRRILGVLSATAVIGLLWVMVLWFGGQEPAPETGTPTHPVQTGPTLPANPFQPSDFVYNDQGYLTCIAADAPMGIDVSDHQGWIDWQQVAQSGVSFVFVRIGYRGYSQGNLFADEYAHYNLTAAREAGLSVGAYFYSQAITPEEASQEAAWCTDFLKDYQIDLPLVFDWEYVSAEARTGAMDAQSVTQCAQTFCDAVTQAGYEAMIYFNPHLANDYYDLTALQDYDFWLAMYSNVMDYPNRVDYWQYTDAGSIPGIDSTVDINLKLSGLSP